MQTSPIVLRDLSIPIRERHAGHRHTSPYMMRPLAERQGNDDEGWSTYQDTKDSVGSACFRLRVRPANEFLQDSRLRYVTAYYGAPGSDWFPLVVLLPHGRYLAATGLGEGMCVSIEPDVYEDPEEAARAAHALAERTAEEDQRADEEFQAEFAAEEAQRAAWSADPMTLFVEA